MVAAMILAAGRSTRMRQSKALLFYGSAPGQTFVARLIDVLKTSLFLEIAVVGRPGDELLKAEVVRCGGTFVENSRADEGQLSSLLAGLAHLRARHGAELDAILVAPVDAPLISTTAVGRLMRAYESSPAEILRPAHEGKHGHPVMFRRSTFEELESADPSVGARAVVRANPARVEDVEIDEAGVTIDFDTPEEYRRYFGMPPPTNR